MIGIILVGLLAQSPPPLVQVDAMPLTESYGRPASGYSRLGFAALAGIGVNALEGPLGLHGRVGARLGLLDRTQSGEGANIALAVLAGAGNGKKGATFGIDLRIELVYVGNKVEALEPIANLYFTTGVVLPTNGFGPIGFHVGGGLGFDLMFSGLLGNTGSLWSAVGSSREIGLVIAAVILIVTSPTVEGRYTVRADGSGFGSVVIGVGI
jgi:hypothetical protein